MCCRSEHQIRHFKRVHLSYVDYTSTKLLKYPGVLANNASLHIQRLNEKVHFDLPPPFIWLCPPACEILVPWPRIKPMPPAVEVWSLKPLDSQGSPSPFLDVYRSSISFWSWWGYLRDAPCSLVSPGLARLLSTQTPVFLTVNIETSLDCQRIRPGWWARQGGMKMPIIFHKQNKLIYRFKGKSLQEHPAVRTLYWNRIPHTWRQNKMDRVAYFPSLLRTSGKARLSQWKRSWSG